MSQIITKFVILFYLWIVEFYTSVSDGEFDPGSGRTLATCLRNASRAEAAMP